jgi:hypothetical protein
MSSPASERPLPLSALLPGRAAHRWAWLAWALWLVVAVIVALTALSLFVAGAADGGQRWGLRGATILPALVYSTVGALILARHPWHMVGLLVSWLGLGSALQAGLEEYALWGLVVAPGSLPAPLFVAWLCNWIWIPINGTIAVLLPLYFPSGHLPSRRWRLLVVLGLLSTAFMVFGFATLPGSFGSALGNFANPYSLERFGPAAAQVSPALAYGSMIVLFLLICVSVVHLLRRLARARGVERQQLKWFVYAVLLTAVLAPGTATALPLLHLIYVVASIGLPIAIGLAVLRYRLYDIDLIVNRTLVYGVLSGLLALIYFGAVVVLQGGLGLLTGRRDSPLIIVLSTLAVAAAAAPLRARVQSAIDRRFYRRRYDAGRALAAFSHAARATVDLEPLSQHLVGVVQETLEPAHVGLTWVERAPNAVEPPR